MVKVVTSARGPGRPREPSIEAKATRAAIQVYASGGWAAFTFDAVARQAGVGKSALYRRWDSREDLLVSAIDALSFPSAKDCGSLREDLRDYARQWVEWYADPDQALAFQRLYPDLRTQPTFENRYHQVVGNPRLKAARDITRRAVARGEVPSSFRTATIVELLVGALQSHYSGTPKEKHDKLAETFPEHAETLVNVILAGVQSMLNSGRADLTRQSADGQSARSA